jgi:hypothetical protein
MQLQHAIAIATHCDATETRVVQNYIDELGLIIKSVVRANGVCVIACLLTPD